MPEPGSYRDPMHGAHGRAREMPLAPSSLSGLNSRLPYLRRLMPQHFSNARESNILDPAADPVCYFARCLKRVTLTRRLG